MAGIFFEGGVSCSLTVNAACDVELEANCEATYYGLRCNVGVDPVATNALISEIANAINVVAPYDCTRLDNLADALATIWNQCSQPTQPDVLLDDFLSGCFNGTSGKVNVSQIVNLVLAEIDSICELPLLTVANPLNTFVATCVAGEERLVSAANITLSGFGGRRYQYVNVTAARVTGTPYRNNHALPIQVLITGADDFNGWWSADGITWVSIGGTQANGDNLTWIVPPGDYYRTLGAGHHSWVEFVPTRIP